jgi:hypothetical protein
MYGLAAVGSGTVVFDEPETCALSLNNLPEV